MVKLMFVLQGHAASIRHEDRDAGQFEMIEIPLKGEPSCIAIGKSLGGIGVAVEDTMLIYSYVQKAVADTDLTYRSERHYDPPSKQLE